MPLHESVYCSERVLGATPELLGESVCCRMRLSIMAQVLEHEFGSLFVSIRYIHTLWDKNLCGCVCLCNIGYSAELCVRVCVCVVGLCFVGGSWVLCIQFGFCGINLCIME